MKTINKKFRKIIIVSTLGFFLISCEKSDPEPLLADQVMGEYVATSYTVGNSSLNLPATSNTGLTISAKITCTKVSENVADFVLVFNQTTGGITTSSNAPLEKVTLTKNANGAIEGIYNNQKDIIWENNKLTLILADPNPDKKIAVFANKIK